MVDEAFAALRRMTRLPALSLAGAAGQEGRHARRGRLRRGPPASCCTTPATGRRKYKHAAAVRLRPGQPPLHPRHPPRQERGRALSSGPASTPTCRLGHADPRRPPPDAGRLRQRLPAQRGRFPPRAHRHAAGQHAGLLHGRDDERDVHRLAPGAGEEPDPPGGGHRLLHPRRPAEPLDRSRAISTSTRFVDAFGNCPPQFLQAAFLMLKPVANFIEKPLSL